MGIFSKIGQGLKKTRDSMKQRMDEVFAAFGSVDEELFEELEEVLVLSDVGAATAGRICDELRRRVKEEKATESAEVRLLLRAVISDMMTGDFELKATTKPSVVLVIGVNGAGKTTTIGKLAAQYAAQGKRVVMAAADTFRAAAIDQLAVWAERSGSEMIRHAEGSDPAAVVFDAIEAGKARGADLILCDTAGRLHNKKNLMDELAKIARVIGRAAPECDVETLLVLDATTGQNALNQARLFGEAAGITGIILTKLDGTAKGGVVIGIVEELGIPVKFIGVGEQIDDLQPFDPERFAAALFDDMEDPA